MPSKDAPRRSSLRHPHFDYSTEAAYFVTINTHQRRRLFGAIKGGIVTQHEPVRLSLKSGFGPKPSEKPWCRMRSS